MAKLFLHIGTHKTGTTAIQSSLRAHRKELRREGIGLLRRLPGSRRIMLADEIDPDLIAHNRQALRSGIRASSRRIERYILSYEGFSGDPYRGYTNVSAVAETLSRITEGFDTTIIVYLRRQDEFVESFYTQSIHEGGSRSFEEFLSALPSTAYDWTELLEPYDRLFSLESLRVRRYSYGRTAGPADVINDFGRLVGSEYLRTLRTADRVNPSYSRDALEFARHCNSTLSPSRRDELRRMLQRCSVKSPSESYSFFNAKERRSFLDQYSSSNQFVASRYLADGETGLFEAPSTDASPPYTGLDMAALSRLTACLLLTRAEPRSRVLRAIVGIEGRLEQVARRVWAKIRDVRAAIHR